MRSTVNHLGQVVGQEDFWSYGLTMPGRSWNNGNAYDRYKFTGHERDSEGGLDMDYMIARNYDPEIGRFMGVDPLYPKYPGLNPYTYVANNPLSNIDLDGRDITSTKKENKDGTIHYDLTYTATIENDSKESLSVKDLINIALNISNQIEESFTGESEDGKVTWSMKVDINVGERRENDNIISIIDMPSGQVGSSHMLGNIQKISSSIVFNDRQVARTGAHEFGHGAGLGHPKDSNGNMIRTNNMNLMVQSAFTQGTNISQGQIEEAHQLINFWYGARKK